jgi:hypothetical protein
MWFLLGVLPEAMALAQSPKPSESAGTAGKPEIRVTELSLTEHELELQYQIVNSSERDVWILAGINKTDWSATAFMSKDGRTVVIQARLDVPRVVYADERQARYVRLRRDESWSERIFMTVPVRCESEAIAGARQVRHVEFATRACIEIGYFDKDLTSMLGGALHSDLSEGLRAREDEVLVGEVVGKSWGEQVMRATLDDVHIACQGRGYSANPHPPSLPPCARMELRYRPSALEYFFPCEGQRRLLNAAEQAYLRSTEMVVVDDPEAMEALREDVSSGIPIRGIVRKRSAASLVCHGDGASGESFIIYNDESIVTEQGQRFAYFRGFPSLRKVTPQAQSLDYRVRCASNLKDLWHRFLSYHTPQSEVSLSSSGAILTQYPMPRGWCTALKAACPLTDYYAMKPFSCPTAEGGKCHYAMNRDCEPTSPGDTVLLFETTAGWNQHGGPELFTFDNHDPKGGCVLLNDGTVKFVRTKEELAQLRWKP